MKFEELVLRMWPTLIDWRERFPATLLAQLSETSASSRELGTDQSTAAGTIPSTPSSSLRATLVQRSAQGYVLSGLQVLVLLLH